MGKWSPDPISVSHRRLPPVPLSNPTSPFDRSPKGWKNRESDGVGLGIVAALDKSSSPNLVVNFYRVASPPIPIAFPTTSTRTISSRCHLGEEENYGGYSNKGVFWNYDNNTNDGLGFFCASPPMLSDDFEEFPVAGFLRSCYLCSKNLAGKDIYMYRGDKSFCSSECRYRQIVADEYQESCSSEASKPSESSKSVYSGQRLFHTGVMAA